MTKIQKATLILEVLILFGPVTLFLLIASFYALASWDLIFDDPGVPIVLTSAVFLGVYGLYVFLYLVWRTLKRNVVIPKYASIPWGAFAGFLPCIILTIYSAAAGSFLALAFFAPVLGGLHVLWLNKDLL